MKLLSDYFNLQNQIFEYFGYVENWTIIPLEDHTSYYWCLNGEGPGRVLFADTIGELEKQYGNYYECIIYTNHHLSKWVYRAKDYTMIALDTQTDSNKVLAIFDNTKEHKLKFE